MTFTKPIPYNVTITAVNGGFIAEVGCQRFAYTDPASLAADLRDYLIDPDSAVKKYEVKSGAPTAQYPEGEDTRREINCTVPTARLR